LEELGVLSMLSPALFSEEEGIEKPSPEIWHRALNRAGLDASQAIHIGDDIAAYVNFCFLGVTPA
jgi:FMN phosphatase YigB (HAD superfamily)